jgi:hypothetical protein
VAEVAKAENATERERRLRASRTKSTKKGTRFCRYDLKSTISPAGSEMAHEIQMQEGWGEEAARYCSDSTWKKLGMGNPSRGGKGANLFY